MTTVKYNEDRDVFEIDTGKDYLLLPREDAQDIIDYIQRQITKINLEEYRKDFTYEGNSL